MCQVNAPTYQGPEAPTYTHEQFEQLCAMMREKYGTPRWALVLETAMEYAWAGEEAPGWLR